MRTVYINPERCIGCRQCEFACAVAHSESKDPAAALAEDPLPRARIHVSPGTAMNTAFPNRCRHCSPAPCEQVCPTGAIARDATQDLVMLDVHQCISCAMCAMVCPFDAVTFHTQANGMPPRVVAIKCDGCIDRIRDDQEPACVEACKVGALVYGELNELIAANRLRESAAVLAATSSRESAVTQPAGVVGWRSWGEAATKVFEEI
ncbi:MAG: 4Fe-4S dicluster domain-containing protein [Gammaproteobacteria bacterium]|nr:4Fe-4S dicluster domain-containing protein [Gammaproteobacteria bacterium]